MTLNEFELLLTENHELQLKYKELASALSDEDLNDKAHALYKIIQELGYDVPLTEINLHLIGMQPWDEKEMDAVAGGGCAEECWDVHAAKDAGQTHICFYDHVDKHCWFHDGCSVLIKDYDA